MHTIKSKYNFILHLYLLKIILYLLNLYFYNFVFDGGALGSSYFDSAPAFIATLLLPKLFAFATAFCDPENCGTVAVGVGVADGVGVGWPPLLDRLDLDLDRLDLDLDRLALDRLDLDRLDLDLVLVLPPFMPDPPNTVALCTAFRCRPLAITLPGVAVETVAGIAALPFEGGATDGLTITGAYWLDVGVGVGVAVGTDILF
jgi:hypothetical protein